MGRVKTQNTDHSYLRAAERCGWDENKARKMMKLAQKLKMKQGTSFHQLMLAAQLERQ